MQDGHVRLILCVRRWYSGQGLHAVRKLHQRLPQPQRNRVLVLRQENKDEILSVAVNGVPNEKGARFQRLLSRYATDTQSPRRTSGPTWTAAWALQNPPVVVMVDELPRTASGKIRKVDLRQRYAGS
jgi:acyl-CoA synthetase (AMP-forming)/AMP-acid ligase II